MVHVNLFGNWWTRDDLTARRRSARPPARPHARRQNYLFSRWERIHPNGGACKSVGSSRAFPPQVRWVFCVSEEFSEAQKSSRARSLWSLALWWAARTTASGVWHTGLSLFCHPLLAYQLYWRQPDLFLLASALSQRAKTNWGETMAFSQRKAAFSSLRDSCAAPPCAN